MILHETETLRKHHTLFTEERRNSTAFIRLMKLCRPLGDIDEAEELDTWRQEKYGNESSD